MEDIDKELLHEGNEQCIENVSSNPKEPSPLEDIDKELLHEGNEQCIEIANVSRTIVNDNISCELGFQSSPTKVYTAFRERKFENKKVFATVSNKCEVKIKEANLEDNGIWKCDVFANGDSHNSL